MTSVDFETVGSVRLLQLAEHLEKGTLGHKKFSFGDWNDVSDIGGFDKRHCGTVGCALGEAPFVWPRKWGFNDDWFEPALKRAPAGHPTADAERFFGISEDESEGLFTPYVRRPWAKGRALSAQANRRHVARSIRQFVTWKLAQIERTQ